MKYLLSMDGGGTKTAWLLTTVTGNIISSYETTGCSHPQMGLANTLTFIYTGINEILRRGNCTPKNLLGAAFGIPCYGEYPRADEEISSFLHHLFPQISLVICNDVELGFAGASCLNPGIHIVAGTGAIAFGKNNLGRTARSNGWHPSFSDEGSGYWLGMQTLSLFTKQADGRIPHSPLYDILLDTLSLSKAQDILSYYDNILAGNRKNIASLQLILKKAADSGDLSAIHLYESAAHELYLSIRSVYHTLNFSKKDPVKITYSGGLFYNGSYILPSLTQYIEQLSAVLIPPFLPPVYGGILLAMQGISLEKAKDLSLSLRQAYNKEEQNGYNQTRNIYPDGVTSSHS